jgi:hypothetical protein
MLNRRQFLASTGAAAAGLAAGALAAPAASARPAAPASREPVVIEPAPAPVVQSIDEGFDWASAAIGAGAAGGLVLLVVVGASGYRQRREHVDVTP